MSPQCSTPNAQGSRDGRAEEDLGLPGGEDQPVCKPKKSQNKQETEHVPGAGVWTNGGGLEAGAQGNGEATRARGDGASSQVALKAPDVARRDRACCAQPAPPNLPRGVQWPLARGLRASPGVGALQGEWTCLAQGCPELRAGRCGRSPEELGCPVREPWDCCPSEHLEAVGVTPNSPRPCLILLLTNDSERRHWVPDAHKHTGSAGGGQTTRRSPAIARLPPHRPEPASICTPSGWLHG